MAKRKSRRKLTISKGRRLKEAEAKQRHLKRVLQSMSKKKVRIPTTEAVKEARKREKILRRVIQRASTSKTVS